MSKSKETSQRLVDVAIDLFAKKGYKSVSIRDIAKVAGVRMSGIYYHFGSKYELLLAVLDYLGDRLQKNLSDALANEKDPTKRFETLISTNLDQGASFENAGRIFFIDELGLSPKDNDINKQFQTKILDIYRKELESAKAAGLIDCENLTVAAFHVIAVIQWHLKWYKSTGPLSLDQVKASAIQFIFNGLKWNTDSHPVKKRGRAA